MFLGNSLILWKCKKQPTLSKSSAEAEYRSMSSASKEVVWLRRLVREFGAFPLSPTSLYVDNTSAIRIAKNTVYHERTKHRDRLSLHSATTCHKCNLFALCFLS
eukprot:TRINITY_DN16687_c0_g1_i10.p1 TRINITY_DN16687_c0_g1~~TRINITY_DN16687_c0_g1_i10.p1  ORF type:complete len:104 (+),score=9.52 TRINITY_DN16687_c0_g1_i10:664-975(+)